MLVNNHSKTMNKRILPILFLFMFTSIVDGRTWKNDSGRRFKGEIVSVNHPYVTIRKAFDYKIFTMRISDLSQADEDYINNLLEDDIFLGDLKPMEQDAFENPVQVNENSKNLPVKISGKVCRRYIFAHASSRIVYDLPSGVKLFRAYGVSPAADWVSRSWKYKVSVDGKTLYTSDILFNYVGHEVFIEVEIPGGSQRLELEIDNHNGEHSDYSIWAEPKLIITNNPKF